MTAERKLIVILVDGLSADYFESHEARLPYLSLLRQQGTQVRRLRSPVPATSMPGRTSMITGAPSEQHGVFGNHVFDGTSFRCASPEDVAVPTVARRAKDAGLRVASLGYAMVRPGDASIYRQPWWLRGWESGSRFAKIAVPVGGAAEQPALPEAEEAADAELVKGLAGDHETMRAVADLACSDAPPDLILTEISTTDQIQHRFGYESEAAHWSLATADLLVGALLHRLELTGRRDDYVVVATSDHGHSPIETAIYPDLALPGALWQSEGATLHVAVRDDRERREAERRLADLGAAATDSGHVPAALRGRIATFVAPARHSFEESPAGQRGTSPTGRPAYVSSHGLRPGTPADDRFCLFAGAGVPRGLVETASAEQFCPTLASILGLPDAEESLLG